MQQRRLFNILDIVDSTNNYAMQKVHEGLATHGEAWFAHAQHAGRGQRGRAWSSQPGKNIHLSLVLRPIPHFFANPYAFSALIAICCQQFIAQISTQNICIKWPNDLYWGDRKAGGILIENNFSGSKWNWAVVGIGINVNQMTFDGDASRAVSLKEISAKHMSPVSLAEQLHLHILAQYDTITPESFKNIIPQLNAVLYKKNEEVRLKKDGAAFLTRIKEVNEKGQLVTQDVMEHEFDFGSIEWVI